MDICQIYDFVCSHMEFLSLLISAISAIIAAFALIAAFLSNSQNKKQYLDSIQPQLSMSLVEFDSVLYLRIKNSGETAAKNICITVNCIKNNGWAEDLNLDGLFETEFELYPEEAVQGKVAFYGASAQQAAFPQIDVVVSYKIGNSKKTVHYSRTVTYLNGCTEKIAADLHVDATGIERSLESISRASVRTANYLDGCQIFPFDELNILAKHSLKTDLQDIHGIEPDTIPTRAEAIADALKHRKEENSDANT